MFLIANSTPAVLFFSKIKLILSKLKQEITLSNTRLSNKDNFEEVVILLIVGAHCAAEEQKGTGRHHCGSNLRVWPIISYANHDWYARGQLGAQKNSSTQSGWI